MRELLWDEMNALEAKWTIEKRIRVTEVFLAVLVSNIFLNSKMWSKDVQIALQIC